MAGPLHSGEPISIKTSELEKLAEAGKFLKTLIVLTSFRPRLRPRPVRLYRVSKRTLQKSGIKTILRSFSMSTLSLYQILFNSVQWFRRESVTDRQTDRVTFAFIILVGK